MKRQLNKIIFIGSAFNYAEINLDGHTCVVGSNGVGKSTLLRAITFFYHPTNQKKDLGIAESNKSFAQYYLEGLGYLIYEVKTEQSYFHVIFYKKDNLELAYRFIDTHYDQKYYIDNLQRTSTADPTPSSAATTTQQNILPIDEVIHRLKAEQIYCSDEFSGSYKDYKAIIYGNYYASKKEKLRQFYLLRGTEKSHQIPTVIKDILLFSNANVTKLVGAKFVKEFIANTVADRYEDEAAGKKRDFVIDLRQMQADLEKFTRKYKDIRDFYKSENQKLKEVIKQLHQSFNQLRKDQKDLITSLAGLTNYVQEQQVLLVQEIANTEQKIENLTQEFEGQKQGFTEAIDHLTQQTAESKINYDRALRATKQYESAEFQAQLATVKQKENLQNELKAKQEEFAILSVVFSEIETKYKALFAALQNEKDTFQNQQNKKLLDIETVFNNSKMQLNDKQNAEKQAITEKFAIDKKLNNEDIGNAKAELATLKGYYKLIEQTNYFASQFADLQKEKNILTSQIDNNHNQIALQQKEIERLQADYQNFAEKIDTLLQNEQQKIAQQVANLQEKIGEVSKKLAIQGNSLYGYLSASMPDWRDTVGKIFQENILFRTDLTPQMAANFSQDFYGLQIDLDKLEVIAKSLADYENEKAAWQNQIQHLQNEGLLFKEQKNKEKQAKSVELSKKRKEIEDSVLLCNQAIEKATLRKDNILLQIEDLNEQAKTKKQAELQQNITQQNKKQADIEELARKQQQVDRLIEQEKQSVEQNYKTQVAGIEQDRQQNKAKIATETQTKLQLIEQQHQQLTEDKTEELAGKELDTHKIVTLESLIANLRRKLEQINLIESNANYQRILLDKTEFADNLQTYQQTYEQTQQQLKEKKLTFAVVEKSYSVDLQQLNKQRTEKVYQKTDNDKDLAYCKDNFKNTSEYVGFLYFDQIPAQAHESSIIDLIGKIQTTKGKIYENQVEFGNAIRKFISRFEDDNSLGFALKEEETDKSYINFANYLADFEINQRIADTQRETKNLTQQLVALIDERVESLLSKKQEVFKKVNEINREINHSGFVEAGLIDYFEMKPLDTDNLIIQKMQHIASYKNDLFTLINFEPTQDNRQTDTQKLIDLLNSLHENIKQSKESTLSLQDTFEINFSFKEGKNEVHNKTDLDSIGSNGTTTLIKTIIYIALLYSFAKLSGEKFNLHCILDEVGTISANNLKKLLEYANSRNILLVNALPNSAKIHELYAYTWNIYKDEQGEQKINLLISTKAKLG